MFVDSSSAEGSLSPVLRELEVPILSNGECEDLYRRAGHPQYIPDIFLCAGYRWGGVTPSNIICVNYTSETSVQEAQDNLFLTDKT